MKLYYGSNTFIDELDLDCSKPNKDFGRAFYLSDNVRQAQDMAEIKCIQFGGTPCVNVFCVNEQEFELLAYKRFDEYGPD